jgi:hypothetical protein
MSFSNSSKSSFDGLSRIHVRKVREPAIFEYNEGRDVRVVRTIGTVQRTGGKRVSRESKKYAEIMAKHRKILLTKDNK